MIKAWTRQVPEVVQEIETRGIYRVKEEYIRLKNDNIADYYLELYRWYTRKSRAYLAISEEGEFPIWYSLTEEFRLQPIAGTVVLEVEIPEEKVLVIDMEKWDYRVNNMYVPKDADDRRAFEDKLKYYGIADETALVGEKGNFYPALKREVVMSWDRLFTMQPQDYAKGFATTWELKKEWVKEVVSGE